MVFSGLYLAVIIHVIRNCFISANTNHQAINLSLKFFGLAMVFELIGNIFGAIPQFFFPSENIFPTINLICDGIVGLFFLATGYMFYLGEKYEKRIFVWLLVPLALMTSPVFIFPSTAEHHVTLMCLFFLVNDIVIIYKLIKHDIALRQRYSNIENRTLLWFVIFVILFALTSLFYMLIRWYTHTALYYMLYLIMMICLYTVFSGKLLNQKLIVDEETCDEEQATIENEASVKNDDALNNRLLIDIKSLMEEQQVYKNADLTVYDLVKMLNTNTSYFYYFMRDVMQMKFYDYVNGYRIEHAKRLLTETNTKIEVIAMESGYNSYNSFIHSFKKRTNVSPNQWRQKNSKTQ